MAWHHGAAGGKLAPSPRARLPLPLPSARPAEWKPWEVPEGHTIPMMEEQYAEGTERGAKQVPTPQ